MKGWRALLFGCVAGVLLSAMRAPLGWSLFELAVVDAGRAAAVRAAALIAIAGALGGRAGPGRGGPIPLPPLLLGASFGFPLHGLLLASAWEPETGIGLAVVWFVLFVSLALLARGRSAGGERAEEESGPGPPWAERIGLGVAAAGTAIALECLCGRLRLLGLGLAEDDTVIGAVLIGLLFVGAVAFGRPLALGGRAPAVLAVGLGLGAAGCLIGIRVLSGWEQPGAFGGYVRRFGLDLSQVGGLRYLALLSAVVLVVPGFLTGAALAGARHPWRLASVALGAAAGALLWSDAVALCAMPPTGFTGLVEVPWCWQMTALALLVSASGGLLAVASGSRGRVRAVGAAATLAVVAALPAGRRTAWLLSPWSRAPVEPLLVAPIPEGLLTVERARDGTPFVTLDRRRLTPTGVESEADSRRIRFAWSLLPEGVRSGGGARILFVGAMTPSRSFAFGGLGEIGLDVVVPWERLREPVEAALFEDSPFPRAGRAISASEAERRLERGSYDLVIVPPSLGPAMLPKGAAKIPWAAPPAPVISGLSVPPETIAVVWIDASATLAQRDLGERAVLSSDGLDDLCLGVILGDVVDEGGFDAPALLDPGPPASRVSGLSLVTTLGRLRADRQRTDLTARLAAAAEGTKLADLTRGLHLHAAAQRPSSPFETLDQAVELDDEALDLLRRHALAAPPDPFVRQLWEGIARVLVGKRMPDLVLRHVAPLADEHGSWPELERAVAAAYMEFDMAAEAAERLERALVREPRDIGLLLLGADWSGRAGDGRREVELLSQALALQPGRRDVELLLAIARMRIDDPRGREWITRTLEGEPENDELRELLRLGPGPRGDPGLAGGDRRNDR